MSPEPEKKGLPEESAYNQIITPRNQQEGLRNSLVERDPKTKIDVELDAEDTNVTDSSKKPEAGNANLAPMGKLFSYADTFDKWLMILGALGGIASGVLIPLRIVLFGNTISDIQTPVQSIINERALEFVYLSIGAFIGGFFQCACWTITASRQSRRIREEYIAALIRQEIGWFDLSDPKHLASKVADVSLTIQDGIGRKLGDGFNFIALFFAGIIIALVKGWKLALILLALAPLMAITALMMIKRISQAVREGMKSYGKAGGVAEEALANIKTVQSFNSGNKIIKRYEEALKGAISSGIRKHIAIGSGVGAIFFTIMLTYAVGMYFGGVFVSNDQLEGANCVDDCYDGGRVLIIFFSVIMASMSLGQAGPTIQALASARAAAYDVFELIERKSKIDSDSTEGVVLDHIEGDIKLVDIQFHYPSRPEVQVCNNYNLTIKAGQKVALVGPSGCGKSTIVSLLERFYDPIEGRIFLDGVDLSTMNVKWLRSQIGLVGQEPALFACSIAENIGYGKPNGEVATIEEVKQAAKMANAYDFIMSFPDGFDTEVGQLGSQLSGGQKQRIAIARAIIKNPSILLLDEATSALDTESEFVVQASLDKLVSLRKRTTIVIAHRLSTIRDSDAIAVVGNGRVVELGTHDELMQIQDGHYNNLVSLQNKGNDEEEEEEEETDMSSTTVMRTKSIAKRTSMKGDLSGASFADLEESIELETPKANVSLFRLWGMSLPQWKFLMIGTFGAMLNGAGFPCQGILLTKVTVLFFDYEQSKDDMRSGALNWSFAFLGLGFAFFTAHFCQNYGFGIVGENLTAKLRSMGLSSMLRQEIAWFDLDENSSGALSTRLASDASQIYIMTSEFFNRTVSVLFTLGVALVVGFIYSWQMTLAMMGVVPFLMLASFSRGTIEKNEKKKQKGNDGDTKAGALVSEAVNSIRTVVSYGMEKRINEEHTKFLDESKTSEVKNGVISGVQYSISNGMTFLAMAFLFWFGGRLVVNGDITFEEMFMVLMCMMLSATGLGFATQSFAELPKSKKAARSLFSIIDREPAIDATSSEGSILEKVQGDIEFRNVEFTYPTRPDAKIYDKYSLHIKKGTTVALVGASGGGKSTAISLIERFYDPNSTPGMQQGAVYLDGRDLKSLNTPWLRDHISLVSQEPCLFAGSIADNIKYGKHDATRQEVEDAARMANAHDFIMGFPNGFDKEVGDNGVQVSGGQKQRIAIARAIIRDPEVLLLDEATSALDTESERIVQESLDRLLKMKRRTTVVVAHRLSTIRNADLIAVVDKGKIVETGSHEELMKIENGHYRTLVSRQTKLKTDE